MPIDVSEVVLDSDLGQAFTIVRTTGSFVLGGFSVATPANVPSFGVISVATEEELEQIPEGDRVVGSLVFHSVTRMYETNEANSELSDQITFNGNTYKIVKVWDYSSYGYWKAVGTRMGGS